MPRAVLDPALGVRIIAARELRYSVGAALGDDRPAHVRAASGLAFVGGRLAVVQDDAAFIAFVARDEVSAHTLPRGANGRRRFEVALGNKMEKLDLEACVAVGDELWAFGSGSAPAREKIAVLGYGTRIIDAAPLYRRIRDELHGDVNIEGVALVGCDRRGDVGEHARQSVGEHPRRGAGEHGQRRTATDHPRRNAGELWLFHRGNTGAGDRGPAVVRVDRGAFARWLAAEGPVPDIVHAEPYDLGAVGGCRLGFTDAVAVGERVYYLAAAEASDNAIDDGAVLSSQIGVIEGDRVRACELAIDGAPAKAEGLAFDPRDERHAWIAIDPDDVDAPARLYEVELVGPW